MNRGAGRRGVRASGFSTDNFSESRPMRENFLLNNGTFVDIKQMRTPTTYNLTARVEAEERQRLRQM
jgi:hypothetical protein